MTSEEMAAAVLVSLLERGHRADTLEDVAWREVRDLLIKSGELETSVGRGVKCFLRGVQMQKEGVLPNE